MSVKRRRSFTIGRGNNIWRQVGQSEGFDIEDVSGLVGITGLLSYNCQRSRFYPDSTMIKQYAELGLHRYNMLEGTSFELSSLLKFNMLQNLVSSYYITLLAHDQEASPLQKKTFQVRVDEKKYGSLDVVVSVGRLKKDQDEAATTKKPFMPHVQGGAMADPFFQGELPDQMML
ncbi:putative UPF0725 protein [Cardamine amara subsp. amara]|uniref:UPF0725 protein n=1 Tax=Cardamine amara subsp. amara TaxID=228776 RepID=A0ABD1ANW4_CARAN